MKLEMKLELKLELKKFQLKKVIPKTTMKNRSQKKENAHHAKIQELVHKYYAMNKLIFSA